MIAGAVLAAREAVNARIDQPLRSAFVQQQEIDAQSGITLPPVPFVIPERVHWFIGMATAHGVGPTLVKQALEAGAAFRLQQCILRPRPARIDILVRGHDVEIALPARPVRPTGIGLPHG